MKIFEEYTLIAVYGWRCRTLVHHLRSLQGLVLCLYG